MKLEVGKEYVTRDGRKAVVLDIGDYYGTYPVAVKLTDYSGRSNVYMYKEDGTFYAGDVSGEDLQEIPKTAVAYQNLYAVLDKISGGANYPSVDRARAEAIAGWQPIGILKLTRVGDKVTAEILPR